MIRLILKKIYKKELQVLVDYIEGRIDNPSFINIYLTIPKYKKLIVFVTKFRNDIGILDDEFDEKLKGDSNNYYYLVHLQDNVHYCLLSLRIKHEINVIELRLWNKWFDYVPSFLNPTPEIFSELEKLDPERKHTKKWYKNYYLQKYKCKNKPPVWIQWGEWPMDDDGEPCLFLYQTGYPNRHDFIEYHFRKKNGEEVIIEQYF